MGLFERKADNPAQPTGWAGGGDLSNITDEQLQMELQKRRDNVQQLKQDENQPVDDDNPAQPDGWAVGSKEAATPVCSQCHSPLVSEGPGKWKCPNGHQLSPRHDISQEPIQDMPYAAHVIGRIFVPVGVNTLVGSRVVLRDRDERQNFIGHVIDVAADRMAVQWEDGRTDLDEPIEAYEIVRPTQE